MNHATAAILVGLLLTGCTLSGAGQKATQEFQWESLRQRPLASPPLSFIKGDCTTQTTVDTDANRQPRTIAYIGDTLPQTRSAIPVVAKGALNQLRSGAVQQVFWIADPSYSGPLMIRGQRLQVPGPVLVAAAGAVKSIFPVSTTADLDGRRIELYREADVPAGKVNTARGWVGYVHVDSPGCYSLQVDGIDFSEVFVFQVAAKAATRSGGPVVMPPADAAKLVKSSVTNVKPVLLPSSVPDGWLAEVAAGSDGFNVRYFDPTDSKNQMTLAIMVPNPPPGGPNAVTQSPNFHGDAQSTYRVTFSGDPRSGRSLYWIEPGTGGPSSTLGGIPYYLIGNGVDDDAFWRFANSLAAQQPLAGDSPNRPVGSGR